MTKKLKTAVMRTIPVLVLRNLVLLPKSIAPVKVSRKSSINAVEESIKKYNGEVFIALQDDQSSLDINPKKLKKIGVWAKIIETVKEKDGELKILLEGLLRATTRKFTVESSGESGEIFFASIKTLMSDENSDFLKKEAYFKNIRMVLKEYQSEKNMNFAINFSKITKEDTSLESLVDIVASTLELKNNLKISILEEKDIFKRTEAVLIFLRNEIEIEKTEKNIRLRVQEQVEKQQKDYYLNEQIKAIYKELGREDVSAEIHNFKEEAIALNLPQEAMEKLLQECKKLEQTPHSSPEAVISRSYIDLLLSLPWKNESQDNISIEKAEEILEKSHAGMKKVKETIVDFIAAKKFSKESLKSSPIICLVGPPGAGKTTLAESIANALGRTFVRISLGGVRDEAEIRGHRKTYIGSMPGKIIAGMKKAKSVNPVILLDEIDKMSTDLKSDPAAALLEVLDPVQNNAFMDHYLEIGYDLSKVVFIATANTYDGIPSPLLDRMDLINVSGYTDEEKLKIMQEFLLPKALEEHALRENQLIVPVTIAKKIICNYTREAGVRQLNRLITKIIRKGIVNFFSKNAQAVISLSAKNVTDWLGYEKYKNNFEVGENTLGLATGLAWTEVGGDILEIEVVKIKGKGNLTITGQLGDVMQESAQAAFSYIKSTSKDLGIKDSLFSSIDLHLHVPEGATPKDGPSAGIAIATALVSILTGCPVQKTVAMTGEITLQGRVLPVGGLKEKILAATRFKMKKIIIPAENKPEVLEFLKEIPKTPPVVFVKKVEEVFALALIKKTITPSVKFDEIQRRKIYKPEGVILSALKVKSKRK